MRILGKLSLCTVCVYLRKLCTKCTGSSFIDAEDGDDRSRDILSNEK